MNLKFLLLIIFLISISSSVFAQDKRFRIEHITSDNGLSQNFIDCIFEDSHGFMWFGSRDGLNRFDGYSFVIYKTTDGTGFDLSDNFIQSIQEDKFGNLWIGTRFGLNRFDYSTNKFTQFLNREKNNKSLASNWINHLYKDRNDNLWIGTQEGDLDRIDCADLTLDEPTFKHYRSVLKLPLAANSYSITSIASDNQNQLWVGTDVGLFILDKDFKKSEVFKSINSDPQSISSDIIRVIYKDINNKMWVGTENGLNLFEANKHNFKRYLASKQNNMLVNGSIQAIVEDKMNNLLIATLGGLHQFNRNTQEFYYFPVASNDNYSLNNEFVNSLYSSKSGVVWIGTEKGGVNKYNVNQKNFHLFSGDFNNKKGLNSLIANSIYEDQQSLWIGTAGGGLNRFNKQSKQFEYYKNSFSGNSISHNFVSALKGDPDDNLWIGTWGGGLNKLSTKNKSVNFKVYNTSQKNNNLLINNFISSLAFDDLGMLWIGGGVLDILNPKTDNVYHLPLTSPNSQMKGLGCMLFDRKKNLWCGTVDGLYKINLGKSYEIEDRLKNASIDLIKHNPNDSKSISSNYITSIYEDMKGTIWFGTYGKGLNKLDAFDPKTKTYHFTNYTQQDGLANNVIYGILEDDEGQLWVSTDRGISRFDTNNKKFRNFYDYDGLQGNQFYWSAYFRNTKGQIYFGGTNGVSYFSPKEIVDNVDIPNVVITDLKIFNKSILTDSVYKHLLSTSLIKTKKIDLSYKESMLSIEFSALSYEKADKNKYAYMLESVDKDWVNVDASRRFANYTNLKGGRYLFKVKASNSDGVWNQKYTEMVIEIHPPFWSTIWFQLFASILLTSLIVFYFRYRTTTLIKQKKKLEVLVERRTHQIETQKKVLETRSEELELANTLLEEHNQLIEEQKAELEANNYQISSQRDEVVELNKKVKLASQMKIDFFTNISHEFRTPLTLILGPLEKVMSKSNHNEETNGYLNLIKRHTNRLLNLVNELMDFRKIETRKMELIVNENDIVDFLKEMTAGFSQLADLRRIDYKFETKLPSFLVKLDYMKVEKIIFNLISNAFKFTPNNGKITVQLVLLKLSETTNTFAYTYGKVIDGEEYIGITVKDTGIGMNDEDLQHILKKFYRVSSPEVASVVGSGIGLSLTKNLVKLHQGMMGVNSEKNVGSEFTVFLPTNESIFANQANMVNIKYQPETFETQIEILTDELTVRPNDEFSIDASKRNGTERILVVEDNVDLRTFIIQHLSTNYKVVSASNGAEGLKLANEKMPDIIISDIMMPMMSGVEMCLKIKGDINTCHIPVILLTAKSDKETQLIGLETGADDYISKPFDIQILEARIHSILINRRELRKSFIANVNLSAVNVVTNSTDETFLQKAINVVQENLMDPSFGVQHLIDKMCVSHSLLHKKLVSLTNQSAVDFITSIRLNKSIQLMKGHNMSLSEIAFKVGFNDPKYFSRCFKKFFGKSPSEYSSSHLNTGD